MGALTRVDVVVLQRHLHDDAGGTDMGPLHRHTEVMVAGTPSAGSYQHIVLALGEELAVDALDVVGNIVVVHRREIVIVLHIHHIHHVLADAMSQGVVGAQQTIHVGYRPHVLVEHLLGIHDGTDLEEVEVAGLVGMDVAGKLYLHGTAHCLHSVSHRHLQDFGQRDDTVLKHAVEGDDLATVLIHPVVEHLVVGVEGGGNVLQRAVCHGILHPYLEDVETIVHLEILAHMLQVEGIELGLGLAQSFLQLGGLEHLVGMVGTDAQGLTAIDDILAQSEGETGDALLRRLVADGIVVERAKHTAHRGIEAVTILLAHHLLQDHRHLLLVDDVARGGHICLGVAVEHGGIDSLDGTRQHLQHLVLVLQAGYHIGGIDAGKGLVVGILQQRTGADGDGTLRRLEEGEEVGYQRVGQLRPQEMLQDFLVTGIAQCYRIEIVLLHEGIKNVSAENHGLGNLHRGVAILAELGMALDHVVEEGESPTLSAQRPFADAGEVGILVKLHTVEDCHHAEVLHVAVLHDGVEDDLAVGIHILQPFPGDVFQEGGDGEDGTGTEPTAHVVATDMVEHRVVGDAEDIVLQLLQTADAHDLIMGLRVAEDEVAETQVLLHQLPEVYAHLLRVLVDEAEAFRLCLRPVLALVAL